MHEPNDKLITNQIENQPSAHTEKMTKNFAIQDTNEVLGVTYV